MNATDEKAEPDDEGHGRWNYRVMRQPVPGEPDHLAIHAVHYDADGEVTGWTERPASVSASAEPDPEDDFDLAAVLVRFQRALTEPVLDYATGEEVAPPLVAADPGD